MEQKIIGGYLTRTKGDEIEQNRDGVWRNINNMGLSRAEIFCIEETVREFHTVEAWCKNPILYKEVLSLVVKP